MHWSAAPHHSVEDCVSGVHRFGVERHYVFRLLIADGYYYYWDFMAILLLLNYTFVLYVTS